MPQGYLLHFAKEKMFSVVTSLLFLFVSVLLVLVDIPINVLNQKNHELLALGLFSFMVGMWGLIIIFSLIFRKKETSDVYINSAFYMRLRKIGMIVLFLGAVIDFFRYYVGTVADQRMYECKKQMKNEGIKQKKY